VIRYAVVPHRRARRGDGFEPDLPAGWGFIEIASPNAGQRALYGLHPPEKSSGKPPRKAVPLPTEHEALITSAEQWPPALAVARMAARGDSADFLGRHAAALRAALETQHAAPFFMTRLRTDELIGGATAGEYVWVLRVSADLQTVQWISRQDFYVYDDPASKFELLRRPARKLRAWWAAHRRWPISSEPR
jgi:hypothetical protein